MRKTTKKILAGVLACAMTMATSVMTFALTSEDLNKTFEPLTSAEISISNPVDNGDGTVSFTLSTKGDMGNFEYGVAYDTSTVTFNDVTWNADYSAQMLKISGIMAFNDFPDLEYVTIGGSAASEKNTWYETWSGEIATVTFDLVEGVEAKDVSPVKVVYDPAFFKNEVFDKGLSDETMYDFDTTSVIPDDLEGVIDPIDYDLGEEIENNKPEPTPVSSTDPGTQNPGTDPGTQNPGTDPGAQNPGAQNPGTQPGGDQPSGTDAARSAAPAATAAASAKPVKAATTGDAGIVLPLIAICGATAAVVVASKRRVED